MASEDYDGILKSNIKKLSDIGAEVDEIGVSERIFDKLNEQELAVHKLTNLTRDFVSGRELKETRRFLEEKVEKSSLSLEARIRDQEFAMGRLTELSKSLATKDEIGELKVSINELKSAVEESLRDIESGLRGDIKGLSEVDAEIIDDLSKMETLFGRMDEQDLTIQKLRDLCNTFVGQKELLGLREDIEREDLGVIKGELNNLKASVEKRMSGLEDTVRGDVKSMTEVDGEIIDRLARVEELYEKVNDHGVEIRKLTDIYEGFVDRKMLENFRESIKKEELETLKVSLGERLDKIPKELGVEIDRIIGDIRKLADVSKDFATKQELKAVLDDRVGILEKTFKDTIKALSEVDARIIDDLGKVEKLSEKIREQEVGVRKLSDMYAGFIGERELREVQVAIDRKIERIPKDIEAKIKSLESRIGDAVRSAGKKRGRNELEDDKANITATMIKLKDDFEKGLITKETFEDAQREHNKNLARIEDGLSELGTTEKLAEKVKDLEATVKKLSEQLKRQEKRLESRIEEIKKS